MAAFFNFCSRKAATACAALAACCILASVPVFGQTCPTEDPAIDNAKSHKLFLYFPTAANATFPNFGSNPNVSPAQPFDVAALAPSIGTTAQLIDEIRKVVVDDYCEFNVQVLTTTTNPATMPNPPARRATVAVGSDVDSSPNQRWGTSQEIDTGDAIDIDFARVWAGTYTVCEGGRGPNFPPEPGMCSMTGALTGANSTLTRWAQAIGGSAAHEAGHTYGLAHTDDDPPNDPGGQPGPGPAPGEDAFNFHLMPAGYDLTGPDRTDFRRHFSDRDYGILATNVGLSVETMHNWDLVNPNAQQAASLAIDFLSQLSPISISWSYGGPSSPWINPTVSGPSGTVVFKGQTYTKYRITWSTGNPAWTNPSPGVLAGGAEFHIGTTFTGVDFNQPDPIIITDVTLLDASSSPLALHPRLPSYDAGTVDSAGNLVLNFFAPAGAPQLRLARATILQLPQLATIDALVGKGRPFTRDRRPIQAWTGTRCAPGPLQKGVRCAIARVTQQPHVLDTLRLGQPGVVDCRRGGRLYPDQRPALATPRAVPTSRGGFAPAPSATRSPPRSCT